MSGHGFTFADIASANAELADASAEDVVTWAVRNVPNLTVASSLSLEDIALSHMVTTIAPTARVFTIDTGRLHEQTYTTMANVAEQQSVKFDVLLPDTEALSTFVETYGINGFYDSVDARKACCGARKLAPLKSYLKSFDGWVTGMRRSQAASRADVSFVEYDAMNGGMLKINPLAGWERKDAVAYITRHGLKYNPLQDDGFVSIGCAPCTRAIDEGEHERAGRCLLYTSPSPRD